MTVTERFMDPGQFSIPLLPNRTPLATWGKLREFGHIVITPQWLRHPKMFARDNMLGAARYSGVVLEKERTNNTMVLHGQNLLWHFGDSEGSGPMLTSASFDGAQLTDTIPTIVAATGLTLGTVNNTSTTFTGAFNWDTAIEAMRTVMHTTGAVFDVRPTGKVDVGGAMTDWPFKTIKPDIVAMRHGWGYETLWTGLEGDIKNRWDAHAYVTRVVLLREDENEVLTFDQEATSTSPTRSTYYRFDGTPMDRAFRVIVAADDTSSVGEFLKMELEQRKIEFDQEIDTDHWQLTGGNFRVGDGIYIFDPPSSYTNTQIRFRGRLMDVIRMRIWEADWPLTEGMGVYYVPSSATTSTDNWIDISQYVAWEYNTPSRLNVSWIHELPAPPEA